MIPMEQTSSTNKKQGETSVYDLVYELPHVNVERHTGSLFSDGQVASKDKRIAYELVDGGRKFILQFGQTWGITKRKSSQSQWV
ncbi:hypothetical protein ACEQPO_08395 [Bacillus sp. SL00103]